MEPQFIYTNGSHKAHTNSIWKWKGIDNNRKKKQEKRFPLTEFLRDSQKNTEELVLLGPGCGTGIGCGVGLGFGLVGGVGFGGSPWNHLRLVFGVGAGCGVGFGFGYGQGIGYGFTLESFKSHLSKQSSDSHKPNFIQI